MQLPRRQPPDRHDARDAAPAAPRAGPAGPRDRSTPTTTPTTCSASTTPGSSPGTSAGRCRSTARPETEETIRRVFHYAFHERAAGIPAGYVPKLRVRADRARASRSRCWARRVLPIRLEHGRFESWASASATWPTAPTSAASPTTSWPLLEGLDTLILDALRHEPHPTHFSLDEALAVIERLRPGRAYLTHLSHGFDHGPTESDLAPPRRLWPTMGSTLDF